MKMLHNISDKCKFFLIDLNMICHYFKQVLENLRLIGENVLTKASCTNFFIIKV